jgi:hypothetical protein
MYTRKSANREDCKMEKREKTKRKEKNDFLQRNFNNNVFYGKTDAVLRDTSGKNLIVQLALERKMKEQKNTKRSK